MDGLFAAAPSSQDVPVYGALTPAQEYHLYITDRPAWLLYVAPHYVELMTSGGQPWVAWTWPKMPRDMQVAVWQLLPEDARVLVRTLRLADSVPSS